jgi:peptidoglycan hydrolase CwlO-like protein
VSVELNQRISIGLIMTIVGAIGSSIVTYQTAVKRIQTKAEEETEHEISASIMKNDIKSLDGEIWTNQQGQSATNKDLDNRLREIEKWRAVLEDRAAR